jgi:hypothetical protein
MAAAWKEMEMPERSGSWGIGKGKFATPAGPVGRGPIGETPALTNARRL